MTHERRISTPADTWRERPMASWRGRLAVLASRGEIDGPRVAEAKAALSNWKLHNFLTRECGYTQARADALVDTAVGAPKTPEGSS